MSLFSSLDPVIDKVRSQIQRGFNQVRIRLLGTNNERLDFLMDSFYKLNPGQRNAVIGGLVGLVAVFLLGSLGLYYSRVTSLRDELDNGFEALHELSNLKGEYQTEDQRFNRLVDAVNRKTRGMKAKPYFEKVARDQNVNIEGLTESKASLSTENPLSEKMEEVKVDVRFPNISIPRLLTFMIELEKGNNLVRVQDLTIRGRYGTKLFFDAQGKFRGYSTEKSGG